MGFFSSLFGGSNSTLNQNIPAFQQEAGFATGVGNSDVTAASKWYNDILSGDPTKMAEAVAPETSAIQGEAQQAKNQTAQFVPRSGGTASAMAGLDANTRSQIIKLLGGLQSTSAGALGSLGTTEQGVALSNRKAGDDASQQQMENWQNSILGGVINGGVDVGMEALTDRLGGMGGGDGGDGDGGDGDGGGGGASLGQFMSPGQISSAFGGPSSASTTTSDLPWNI
jgi:hypothetical protein